MAEEVIDKGDTVKVNYTGLFENGEIFDSSLEEKAKVGGNYDPDRTYEPLVVKIGAKQVIDGFEKALLGMKNTEEKKVTIPPEEGYGNFDASLVKKIPRGSFKSASITPEVGMLLNTQAGIGKIIKINSSDIDIDFNSPLAGKTLVFEIKVEEILKR
jgi:FKBP-type peptidyl-prolyl cis-trans isomerase 2